MRAYAWNLPAPIPDSSAAEFGGLPGPIARVLFRRGFADRQAADSFFNPATARLGDPLSLKDMPAAAGRIRLALENGDPIVVYGDYDADGVTASALMVSALDRLGANVQHYIPNRFEEGYGLNQTAIEQLSRQGNKLLVTVDCGIRSVDEVALARTLGMDVIITDHHQPGPELPAANAIVNPNQPEDDYPFGGLSGVGLAHKVVSAVAADREPTLADSFLDLVALGTVADVSPLVDENRSLVARGMRQLQTDPRPGLRALMRSAGMTTDKLAATHIAFGLAPRINAAGRLDSAELAFDLLMATEAGAAAELASRLETANRQRQALTRKVFEMARHCGPLTPQDGPLIFAVDAGFNEGVVGLAASRLADEFLKPAFVARLEDGLVKGSARSVPGFHITRALEACSDLLLRFGGHAAAAGFTLKADKLQSLLDRLEGQAEQSDLKQLEAPQLAVDTEVSAAELNMELLEHLDRFEPTGEANPRPVFVLRGASVLSRRAVGSTGAHLKLSLMKDHRPMDGIAFRQGDRASYLPQAVDVAFNFERNEFRGVVSPQLNILDLRQAEAG